MNLQSNLHFAEWKVQHMSLSCDGVEVKVEENWNAQLE